MDPHIEDYIKLNQQRRARKSEKYFLDLQQNERALLDAASRIYAAYVTRGSVGDDQIDTMISRSIHEAAKMAYTIERSVEDAAESRAQID